MEYIDFEFEPVFGAGWHSIETVTLTSRCYEVGDYVFYNCQNLKNFTIKYIYGPNAVILYKDAFLKCPSLNYFVIGHAFAFVESESSNLLSESTYANLTTILISSSCEKILSNAFTICTKLENIIIQHSDYNLEIGFDAFRNCPITQIALNRPITASGSPGWDNLESITYGPFFDGMNSNVFANLKKIVKVIIPYSVKNIQKYAFNSCLNLKEIDMDHLSDLITISTLAFHNCPSLNNLKIRRIMSQTDCNSTDLTGFSKISNFELILSYTLGENEFCNFVNLTNITLPYTKILETGTFKNCIKLKTAQLSNNLKFIKSEAFYNCISLESISIPKSVVSIGNNAFAYCSKLTSLHFENSSTEISANCFLGCTSLKTVSLPEKIKVLQDRCFKGCSNLSFIMLPETVESIGSECFSNTSIECLYINPGCTVNQDAFKSCSKLYRIEFLQNSTALTDSFSDCDSISVIIIEDNVTIYSNAFSSTLVNNNIVSISFFGKSSLCPEKTVQAFQIYGITSINTTSLFSGERVCGIQVKPNPYFLPKYRCINRHLNPDITLAHELIFGRSIFHSLAQTCSIYGMLIGT